MSAILNKLLRGQKVEWLPINEIVLPTKNIKWKDVDSIYQYIDLTSVDRKTNAIIETSLIDKENAPSRAQKIVEHNDIIFATTRPTQMRIAVITEELHEQIASTGYCILRADIKIVLPKWIYYNLSSVSFKNYLEENESGSAYPAISDTKLKEFKIPIPPLDVQAEIVRILDAFTAITAELTQELAKEKILREKQYQYYRDKLLSFSEAGIATDSNRQQQTALCEGLANNVKQNHQIIWKSLGEVAEYSKSRISFDKLNEKNYIGVDNLLQNRMGKTNSSYLPTSGNLTAYFENDILIGNIRPYLKKIWQANQIGGTNGDVLVIHLKDKNILPRYLYQILADDKFFDFNMQNAKGAKMPRGNKEAILKYSFPVPPLDEQKRIVNILDKFEALTHSITEGLPKEITLREQQYEYYREQLIDFPKN